MVCVVCGIETELTVRNPICERCFIQLVCEESLEDESCTSFDCNHHDVCQS